MGFPSESSLSKVERPCLHNLRYPTHKLIIAIQLHRNIRKIDRSLAEATLNGTAFCFESCSHRHHTLWRSAVYSSWDTVCHTVENILTVVDHDAKVNEKWAAGFHSTARGQDSDSLLLQEEVPVSSLCITSELQTVVQVTLNEKHHSTLSPDTALTLPAFVFKVGKLLLGA